MSVSIFSLILWVITGVTILCSEKVTKSNYFCSWFMIMALLVDRLIRGI